VLEENVIFGKQLVVSRSSIDQSKSSPDMRWPCFCFCSLLQMRRSQSLLYQTSLLPTYLLRNKKSTVTCRIGFLSSNFSGLLTYSLLAVVRFLAPSRKLLEQSLPRSIGCTRCLDSVHSRWRPNLRYTSFPPSPLPYIHWKSI
jgi:hypothetical protein